MDVLIFVLVVLGLMGGLTVIVDLAFDTTKNTYRAWFNYRLRRDLHKACENNGVTVTELQFEDDAIQGLMHQRELTHGFRVVYTGKYNPDAMDAMVRAIATSAGYDIPERSDA